MKTLIACCLILAPAPALAQDRAHNPQQISNALKAGCKVQQIHQQSGKVHSVPAIVRCAKPSPDQVAAQTPAR